MHTPALRSALAGLAAFGILTLPSTATAQDDVSVELSANAGLYFPFNDLGEDDSGEVSLDNDFAYGGNIGFFWPGGFGLEVQGLYAPAEGLEVGDLDDQDTRTNIFQITGDFIYRFGMPVRDQVFVPFIGAGAGYRTLTFDRPGEGPNELEDFLPEDDQASFVANALLGTYIVLSEPVWLRFEVRDYISNFDSLDNESNLQNDLTVQAGLALRL